MVTKDQVVPTSTNLDENQMQKLWLQRVSAATADETQNNCSKN